MKEIVIKLSDHEYNQLIYGDDGLDYEILEQAVVNGTVLEPHGRSIDADEQESIIEELENICINNEYVLDLLGKLKNASTILEAWGNEE